MKVATTGFSNNIDNLTDKIVSIVDIKTIVLIVFALHLFAMPNPKDGFVFDEAYYVPAARDLLAGIASNPEHPFMGKLWGALGIAIFGDNWFGWRIFYVILGTASIYIFYLFCKQYLREREALYATGLLAFENMYFVHSNLALLEIPSIIFAFLGFYLYKRGNLYWAAVAFGLSLLNKETGAFFIIGFFIYHLARRYRSLRTERLSRVLIKTVAFLLILGLVFAVPVTIYDQIYKPQSSTRIVEKVQVIEYTDSAGDVTSVLTTTIRETEGVIIRNALEHVIFTMTYAGSLTIKDTCVFTNLPNTEVEISKEADNFNATVRTDGEGKFCVNQPFSRIYLASGPYTWRYGNMSGYFYISSTITRENFAWSWIIPPIPYRPMPYYVLNVNKTSSTTINGTVIVESKILHPIAWYGAGNPLLWLSIWFLVPLVAENILRRRARNIDLLIVAWIGANYGPMLYLSFVVNRIVYPFYFLNTIPILALGIPYLIRMSSTDKIIRILIFVAFMGATLGLFSSLFPVRIFEQ